MSFAFPILLGGLVLMAIPVLIHLILRQKPKTLPFPAFRFLIQKHRTNLRKLQLRHLLLLLLRMLLIAGLCLALARPKVLSEAFSLSADRPVAAILLFDTSLSMEYRISGGASRLEEAIKRGLELLDQLPEGSKVAILDTAETIQSGKGEWLPSLHLARERIKSLRPRAESAPVTARLEDAYRLFTTLALGQDESRKLPRFLCVFSDRTVACWDGSRLGALHDLADGVPPPLERLRSAASTIHGRLELLQQLRQKLPPATGQDYPDQAVIDLWQQLADRIPAADPDSYPERQLLGLIGSTRSRTRELLQKVPARGQEKLPEDIDAYRQELVTALHTGLKELQGVHAVWVDVGLEKVVDLAILDIELPMDPGQNGPRQIFGPHEKILLRAVIQATGQDYEPTLVCQFADRTIRQSTPLQRGEKKSVPFEIDGKELPPGPHQVQISLATGDLLDFNNRRFVTFTIREPRRVLILTDDPDSALLWKRAIEARKEARFRAEVREVQGQGQLGPGELKQFQAVYLFNVAKPQPLVWAALKAYVEQGGGLAVVPAGENLHAPSYNDDQSAQALLPGKIDGLQVQSAKEAPTWNWNESQIYQHPLLKPIQEWRNLGRDDFIKQPRYARRYWNVEPHAGDNITVIARYTDDRKRPALLERVLGGGKRRPGRVLLFTTRLDSAAQPPWNDYMDFLTSFCVVLPGLTTAYLAGDTEAVQLNFHSGRETPRLVLPPETTSKAFTLHGPGQVSTVARADEETELAFKQAVAAGNYQLDEGQRRVGAFSVNVPAEESLLTRVPIDEIEGLLGKDSVVPLDRQTDLREALQGHWTQPLELLPHLLLGVLLLLALENLLANLFYRREQEESLV